MAGNIKTKNYNIMVGVYSPKNNIKTVRYIEFFKTIENGLILGGGFNVKHTIGKFVMLYQPANRR